MLFGAVRLLVRGRRARMAEEISRHHVGRSRGARNATGSFADDNDRPAAATSRHPAGTSGDKTHHPTCPTANAKQSKSAADASSASAIFPETADRYQQTYPAAAAAANPAATSSATSTAATSSTGQPSSSTKATAIAPRTAPRLIIVVGFLFSYIFNLIGTTQD